MSQKRRGVVIHIPSERWNRPASHFSVPFMALISDLPPEIMENIFRHASHADPPVTDPKTGRITDPGWCKLMIVCQMWQRMMRGDPLLWACAMGQLPRILNLTAGLAGGCQIRMVIAPCCREEEGQDGRAWPLELNWEVFGHFACLPHIVKRISTLSLGCMNGCKRSSQFARYDSRCQTPCSESLTFARTVSCRTQTLLACRALAF